ncbi:MAG: polymer-forming cytoskeletal protein [Candidatus Magasanikbacteria bacterium]
MIFQKSTPKIVVEEEIVQFEEPVATERVDEVETIVGPSVNVEGDFASEGNIIVKGTVSGSVHTSRFLSVEIGAKIMANVRAGNAKISGEVKGNLKIRETIELTSTAKILGDIEARVLSVEPGALLFGKVSMPGIEGAETKGSKSRTTRRGEEMVEIGE